MALSLLVLLVPIALLIGFYRLALDGDEPVLFDPRPAIQEARSARAFPVAEPVGLTDGWRVTAASFRRADGGATLRLGYVAPAGDPVLLVQTNVPVETVLPVELGAGATPRGTVQAGARSWQRYATRPGEEALVWLAPERAVIVVGTTDVATLRALAAALS